MKVNEMIAALSQMKSDAEILCYTEEKDILRGERTTGVFAVGDVVETVGELRSIDGNLSLRFEKAGASDQDLNDIVLVQFISD